MRTTLALIAAAGALSGCGAQDVTEPAVQARPRSATPEAVLPEGRENDRGEYVVQVVDRYEAERLCTALQRDPRPRAGLVRFSYPGPDLRCTAD